MEKARSSCGVDISSSYGQAVIAPADGTVDFADFMGEYGRAIILSHGHGITTRYGHLANFAVTPGQHVHRGDTIGYVGLSGRSTGPHLHYEVRINDTPVNPYKYLRMNVPNSRRQILHLAAHAPRRRHSLRRHSMVGASRCRPAPSRCTVKRRPHYAGPSCRLSGARPRIPPGGALLPDRGQRIVTRDLGVQTGSFSNRPEQLLGQLRAELAYTRADEIISGELHEFVDDLQKRLNLVGGAVCEHFAVRPVSGGSRAHRGWDGRSRANRGWGRRRGSAAAEQDEPRMLCSARASE